MSLEYRIQRLEDIEALKQLKHRYAAACDDDYDADRLAPLFTDDAIWDGGVLGRFVGREAIREFFRGAPAIVPFAIHHVTNPILDVDGDVGTGQWYLWQPLTFAQGDQAFWLAARYEDRYRREPDGWRFEHVTIHVRALSPYEEGWARVQMAEVPR